MYLLDGGPHSYFAPVTPLKGAADVYSTLQSTIGAKSETALQRA